MEKHSVHRRVFGGTRATDICCTSLALLWNTKTAKIKKCAKKLIMTESRHDILLLILEVSVFNTLCPHLLSASTVHKLKAKLQKGKIKQTKSTV